MKTEDQFNPLDKNNLGKSVADALLERDTLPFEDVEQFTGAGIYAIYYFGNFEPYTQIAASKVPIYVGKAVPPGARKGAFGLDSNPGIALYKRLKEHAESIKQAENIEISDFQCRYLVVDDIWIPLGESLLIAMFSPIWNKLIDGFGNHDPGRGRYQQLRSRWDTIHPGRSWANKCQTRQETAEQIFRELSAYLGSQ